jgi:prevent-host-death family protein
MKNVSISDAERNFDQLIAAAAEGETQIILRNGVESAVLISYDTYLKLIANNEPLVDFLLKSPLKNSEIDLSRSNQVDEREPII